MKNAHHIFKFILPSIVLILFLIHPCHAAEHLSNISSISNLDFTQGDVQVTAPCFLLSDTHFTSALDTYRHSNYSIKVLDIENPKKSILRISKINQAKISNQDNLNVEQKLPWWSKSAPKDLKSLDFSKVDGKSKIYHIGKNYRLTLLAKQGHWGMVYLLERLSKNLNPQKICAVKLVFSRADRPIKIEEFHERHKEELQNNIKIQNLDIAMQPYGIIKNDIDHYLLFMEYGENGHDHFKNLSLEESIKQISGFMSEVDKMHASGYSHGDLKVDNMLFVGKKIKLCDWYSLNEFNQTIVGKFRYVGDNLPPEAIRALYFKENENLKYAIVDEQNKQRAYFLHPISADRFCLAVSLLEILEPDLYKNFEKALPKDFNPWAPKSLEFWPGYIAVIKKTQAALLIRAEKMDDQKIRKLYERLAVFMDLNPMKRKTQ